VKLHFAADVRREVAEHLIPAVYKEAVEKEKLEPVSEPDLEDVKLEEDAPLSFVAVIEVKPTIALGDYTGVAVQHAAVPVNDGDVQQTLDGMREQQAQFRSVERAAAPGDLVIVDYTLSPQDHDPSTATGYQFLVGSGGVMPEIDQAVAGLRAGEQREIGLRFPDDHRLESLRGKSGTAKVTVTEIKEKVLPDLDDEFAKSLGEFENLEALRAQVRKQLEARRTGDERRELEDKVVDTVIARHEFGVPDAMVMRQVAHQVEHARERMRRQGIDPDRVPWDYDKLIPELRPGAERGVRRTLLLDAIATKEGVAPTEADVDAEVEKIAEASRRPVAAVRRMMEKSGELEGLQHALRERRTLDFLIQNASITAP
jgi:trigger factor